MTLCGASDLLPVGNTELEEAVDPVLRVLGTDPEPGRQRARAKGAPLQERGEGFIQRRGRCSEEAAGYANACHVRGEAERLIAVLEGVAQAVEERVVVGAEGDDGSANTFFPEEVEDRAL